jgi:hypothetical protein
MKVSQRKAPGAMSAMAFIVKPVKPRVRFISAVVFSAMSILLLQISFETWLRKPSYRSSQQDNLRKFWR